MDAWRDSFAAVHADFEGLFDTWEILVALAFLETRVDAQSDNNSRRPWSPVGRNGWRNQSRRHILERISNGDLHRELIAAGFSAGHEERLTATAISYSEFVAELRWC